MNDTHGHVCATPSACRMTSGPDGPCVLTENRGSADGAPQDVQGWTERHSFAQAWLRDNVSWGHAAGAAVDSLASLIATGPSDRELAAVRVMNDPRTIEPWDRLASVAKALGISDRYGPGRPRPSGLSPEWIEVNNMLGEAVSSGNVEEMTVLNEVLGRLGRLHAENIGASSYEHCDGCLVRSVECETEGCLMLASEQQPVATDKHTALLDAVAKWAAEYAAANPTGKYWKKRDHDLYRACVEAGLASEDGISKGPRAQYYDMRSAAIAVAECMQNGKVRESQTRIREDLWLRSTLFEMPPMPLTPEQVEMRRERPMVLVHASGDWMIAECYGGFYRALGPSRSTPAEARACVPRAVCHVCGTTTSVHAEVCSQTGEPQLTWPECGCDDGTESDEPSDRGFICEHDPRGFDAALDARRARERTEWPAPMEQSQ